MPDNVESLTLEVLKTIQSDLSGFRKDFAGFRTETNSRLDRLEAGVERLEVITRKHRRDIAGILVITKAAAGDFDERVTELEGRMAALESRAS